MATISMEGWPDGNQDNVTQSFLLLADLNSFKMRKTFWYGEYSTCHGEVKFKNNIKLNQNLSLVQKRDL